MENSINEKTYIQLWGVLVALPILAGGIFWLSTIYSDGLANATQISRLDIRMEKFDSKLDNEYNLLMDIRERLVRFEQKNKDNRGN